MDGYHRTHQNRPDEGITAPTNRGIAAPTNYQLPKVSRHPL